MPPATNSRLSPLPPEPAGFNYDIPLDNDDAGFKVCVAVVVFLLDSCFEVIYYN